MDKVEKAYVVEEKHLTEQEKNVVKAIGKGDFSELEKEWDNFQIKAENPEEDEVSLHNPFLSYQSYISFSTHFLYFVHPG
jgi:hypothetical protein